MGGWRYYGQFYICQNVDCLDASSENYGIDYNFIKLTKFLHSFSGVREEGGGIIIKFNQMFSYAAYHFQFVLKPIFVLKFVL